MEMETVCPTLGSIIPAHARQSVIASLHLSNSQRGFKPAYISLDKTQISWYNFIVGRRCFPRPSASMAVG